MKKKQRPTTLIITPPNFVTAEFKIEGIDPYVQNKFSHKALTMIMDKQKAGDKAKAKKKHAPKDFDECFEGAIHRSAEGWEGIPAPAFRCAMISACRAAGFVMTRAKLAVFIESDGLDETDGTPLVKITKGKPHQHIGYVRNETGVVDVRARPLWNPGWQAVVRISFDADMLSMDDVANLLMRAGVQVGIGEGRPDSKKSAGVGWGRFKFADKK